jgi:uncharacterized protein (TIGR03083 family)
VSLERNELLGVANAERQRLGRTIQYANPATWEQPSAAPGWWNRDVMAHLAASDTAAAQLVAGEPATEFDEYRAQLNGQPFTVDGLNAWTVSRRSELPYREVLTTWGQAAQSFLAHCVLLSDEDWATKRFDWVAGDIAARYLVQTRVVEWYVHGEDVRATNGLGPEIEHWPIFLTIDLGVRMLPWTLAQAGHDLTGRSVQIDVEGAGGGSWHWGLGAGEVPPPDKRADAFITGRAPQLALVAGRRLSPDAALDSGNLVVGGNDSLGELIVRSIRAFP